MLFGPGGGMQKSVQRNLSQKTNRKRFNISLSVDSDSENKAKRKPKYSESEMEAYRNALKSKRRNLLYRNIIIYSGAFLFLLWILYNL